MEEITKNRLARGEIVQEIKENKPGNLPDRLVLALQTTGRNPYEELVEICRPITYGLTKRFFLPDYEREDFLQEARTVLVSSVDNWKIEKGMPFLQYYHMQLLNHLNMLVRKNYAQKRRVNLETSSLDYLIEEAGIHVQGTACVTTLPEDMLMLQETMDRYLLDLSPLEAEVFERYVSGQTREEISRGLSLTPEKIQNAIYRCRVKFDRARK